MSDYAPIFNEADSFTMPVSAAVTAGQLLYISGNNTVAATSAATSAWIGVAAFDQATIGGLVTVLTGGVQELAASGAITAGARVLSAAAGAVADIASGTDYSQVVGIAITTASGGKVQVRLAR
jgi:hypothetical protein